MRGRRWRSIFVGLFLGYISLRYIRNVNLFCTFVPLLVAPEVAALRSGGADVLDGVALAITGDAVLYAWVFNWMAALVQWPGRHAFTSLLSARRGASDFARGVVFWPL